MDDPDESCILLRKNKDDVEEKNGDCSGPPGSKRDSAKKPIPVPETNSMCRSYGIVTLILFLALVVFLVFGYVSSLFEQDLSVKIIKPLGDTRPYKFVRLSNELKIILIEDKDADKSAGSLGLVWSPRIEPKELPGLGLVMMYSIVYGRGRGQNQTFDRCLNENGGTFTIDFEEDMIILRFLLNNDGLKPCFQILSSQLQDHEPDPAKIASVISQSVKDLESLTIDPLWQKRMLLRLLSNADSSFSNPPLNPRKVFTQMTSAMIIDHLKRFSQKYLSSNLLHLSLISNMNIEKQEGLLKDSRLVYLKNHKVTDHLLALEIDPYSINKTSRVILRRSQDMGTEISLYFPFKEKISNYQTNPLGLISFLINNPKKDSLLYYLRFNKSIDSISAEPLFSSRDVAVLEIKISLLSDFAEEEDLTNILRIVFSFVKLIESTERGDLFQSLKQITMAAFLFPERQGIFEESRNLVKSLYRFRLEDILRGEKVFLSLNHKELNDTLKLLSPTNCIIVINSKLADTDLTSLQNKTTETRDIKEEINDPQSNQTAGAALKFTNINSIKDEIKFLNSKKLKLQKIENTMLSTNNEDIDQSSSNSSIKIQEGNVGGPLVNHSELIAPEMFSLKAMGEMNLDTRKDFFIFKSLYFSKELMLMLLNSSSLYLNESVTIDISTEFFPKRLVHLVRCLDVNISLLSVSESASRMINQFDYHDECLEEDFNQSTILLKANSTLFDEKTSDMFSTENEGKAVFLYDDTFASPKAATLIGVLNLKESLSARKGIFYSILCQELVLETEEKVAEALDMGFRVDFRQRLEGLEIYIEGFTDRLKVLITKILAMVGNHNTTGYSFARAKSRVKEKLLKEKQNNPKARNVFEKIVRDPFFTLPETVLEFELYSAESYSSDLKTFNVSLLTVFVIGNLRKSLAKEIFESAGQFEASLNKTVASTFNTNLLANANTNTNTSSNDSSSETNTSATNTSFNRNISVGNSSESKSPESLPNTTSPFENIYKKTPFNIGTERIVNLTNSKVFFVSPPQGDINGDHIIMYIQNIGPRIDYKSYLMIWMTSVYLDVNLREIINNFTDFAKDLESSIVEFHGENIFDGIKIELIMKNKLNTTCFMFFLDRLITNLVVIFEDMHLEQFNVLLEKSEKLIRKIDRNLFQKTLRLWAEYTKSTGKVFPDKKLLSEELKNITQDYFIEFLRNSVSKNAGRLTVYLQAKEEIKTLLNKSLSEDGNRNASSGLDVLLEENQESRPLDGSEVICGMESGSFLFQDKWLNMENSVSNDENSDNIYSDLGKKSLEEFIEAVEVNSYQDLKTLREKIKYFEI